MLDFDSSHSIVTRDSVSLSFAPPHGVRWVLKNNLKNSLLWQKDDFLNLLLLAHNWYFAFVCKQPLTIFYRKFYLNFFSFFLFSFGVFEQLILVTSVYDFAFWFVFVSGCPGSGFLLRVSGLCLKVRSESWFYRYYRDWAEFRSRSWNHLFFRLSCNFCTSTHANFSTKCK